MSEEYKKQFRGTWVRPEIFALVESDTLSRDDAWLLLLIDTLVEYGGKDCYASNEYFAARLHLTKKTIGQMIQRLIRVGVLRQTDFDGRRRYLATTWKDLPAGGDTPAMHHRCRSAEHHGCTSYIISNKESKLPGKPGGKVEFEIVWNPTTLFATRLHKMISSVRRPPATKPSAWKPHFDKLIRHGVEASRIEAVLDWYAATLAKLGDLMKLDKAGFVPIAYSGAAFYEKFDRLEACMSRHQADDSRQPKKIKLRETIIDDSTDE